MLPTTECAELMKNEFRRLEGICYLDYAGSALYADSQINDVMNDLKKHVYGNPHSTGGPSATCEEHVNSVRYKILRHFNTDPGKYTVIFTSGATGALKTVAECFAWCDDGNRCWLKGTDRKRGCHTFAYTEDNHTSVLGMRELAPGANLLCLSRYEAYEALNETPLPSTKDGNEHATNSGHNSLFAYPAQSNFSGTKYPLKWIKTCHDGALDRYISGESKSRWHVVLDASSYAATDHLDLAEHSPDFVTVSFYKMFGYPTGLGALLVHNGAGATALRSKKYFGGGTVELALARHRHHVFRKDLHDRFEDGTVNFLAVIALGNGLDAMRALAGPMRALAERTFRLAARLYGRMNAARHGNGRPVFRTYADTEYVNADEQGGIVNFNVLRANGEHVGYNEVNSVAISHGIVLRVGCFCNPGACQSHLRYTDEDLKRNQEVVGHVCGDHIDLIDGKPTGSVRVSFGYPSSESDAHKLYDTLIGQFWQRVPVKPFVGRLPVTADECKYNGMDLKVSRLFVYPIKSCGAFETDEWPLEPYGFRYDRNWMVVSDEGVCMTQLQEPKLCLVRPHMDLQRRIMTLVYAGNEDPVPMTVPLDADHDDDATGRKMSGKICWGGSIDGVDCGDDVAKWLSWNMDKPGLRLVRCTRRNPPDVNHYGNLDPMVIGANQCQYLLITDSTLKWLKHEMENDITEIDEDNLLFRFRGNIVVSGNDIPVYAELTWKTLDIGGVQFQVDSMCERCRMVNVDQETLDNYRKPLSVLAQHKQNGKNIFGIYVKREQGGGDDVVLRTGQRCAVVGTQ